MMKRLLFMLPLTLASSLCHGQLVNDGGTIVVKPGATLFVESNVQNNIVAGNTGTITVEGTLEVQGDLTNNATMTTAPTGSLVKFSGTAPSTFKSNGAVIHNLEVSKANQNVTISDNLTVAVNADFNAATGQSSKLIIGGNDLIMQPDATFTGADVDEYVIADGAGTVNKEVTADGTFTYEVGDMTNYSPLTSVVSGTTYTGASVDVNVVDANHPTPPAGTTDFISRYWNVDVTGTIAGYNNNLTGTYVLADLTGADASAKGAVYNATGMDWTFVNAAEGIDNTISGSTTATNAEFTGLNFFGKANLKVFLQGAYAASSGLMSTTLNTSNLIPLASPYSAAPFNAPAVTAASVPANVTDWILVEARDAANPATVLSQTSAFLKNDGTIIAMDGGPLLIKDANASSIIGIRHRNHLGVRTAAGINLAANPTTDFDFSAGSGVFTNGALSNANMASVSGTNPAMVMWGGDASQNGIVSYNGGSNDRSRILIKVGPTTPNNTISGYNIEDLNLNGIVSYNGGGNDRAPILISVGPSTPNNFITAHQ